MFFFKKCTGKSGLVLNLGRTVNHTKMSADDFQTKYSSVMESMLKSAIAETTKLFETMVDELKAEISQMKKENEDLKTRCSQFEKARNQPTVYTRESEPLPGPSDGSEKCDRAIQCDLVPFRTVLVEQCQPLRHSSLHNQEQQCAYEQIEYSLQDHTYGEGTTQMAFILVKQEDSCEDCCAQSVLKQKEAEPTVVCGLVMSDKAGSPQACACGTENEGPFINQGCSTGEMPLHQKEQGTQGALELPCLEIDSGLQGARNHSSELEHSLVVSLAEIKGNIGDASEVSSKVSETQQELIPEKHLLVVARHQSEVEPLSEVPQQCQREGEMSINEQAHVSQQQCADVQSTEQQLAKPIPLNKGEAAENLKSSVADGGASPQTELVVQRRRGRPPKKAKRLQQRVKETDSQSVSVAALSKGCFSEKDKLSESQQLSIQMEQGSIQAPSTEGSSAIDTLNTQPVEPRERRTSVTLQDAMLLVEAMNQSTADTTFSSPQRTPAQCSPRVVILETVTEVLAESQISLLPVETRKAAGNLPVTELSAGTQPSTEHLSAASVTAEATPTNEAQAHIKGVTSKQLHMVTPSNTSTSSMALSTVAVQTHVQSLQQHPPHPRITSAAPGKQAASHKIIAMPRSVSSLMHHKIAALSPSELPTVVSTVVAAAQKNSIQPSLSSVPQKTIYITSKNSLPVVPSQLTATSTDLHSETLPRPKITIIIPRQVSAVASRNPQPQTAVVATKQESARSAAPVTVSSPQVFSISVDTQTVLDEVATIYSQKKGKPSDNLESPKQTTSVSEPINAPRDACSSLNGSVGLVPTSEFPVVPLTFEQKLCAVVRLTRLPFPVSAKEAVFVSRLPTDGYSETTDGFSEMQSILKDGCVDIATDDGFSCVVPSETRVLPTDISPTLKETSVALCVNTSQMSEELNGNREKASLAPESPDSGPSTSSKVSAPVFEKTTLAIDTTGPPAVSGTVGEATSNSDDKISSVAVQDYASPTDPPIEEKQSAVLIHLTPITTKDASDPHLQLTKAQFLAKLAVTPVTEDPVKASSDDSVTAAASCTETSGSDKERLQRNSLMAQLQSHLKAHLKARTTETNPEPCAETKKQRSENDVLNDKNTTREPLVEDVTSPKMTATDPTPVSPRRPGLCEAGVGPKKTVSEPTSVTSRWFMATRKSTSVSTGRCNSMQQKASPEKTNSPLVRQRRSGSVKESASAKKTKSTSVSPRRSNSTKQSGSPKETKNISVRPRRISSTRDGASPKIGAIPKSKKTSSVSPNRTKSMRDGLFPKKTKSAFSPTTPKVTTNESFCRRRCTFPKDGLSSKQVQRDSKSFSPGCNITTGTKNAKSETGVRWPKLAKDEVSPRKTRESPPTKKPRLSEDGAGPKKNLGVVDAKVLAKANTIDKMKNSSQSKLQNGAKTSQLVENHASYEAVRKCTAKAVWTPPRMSACQTPPAGGKKETSSPRSQDLPLVYPPSVSLLPIPVKAPPVVSPLQPLSVIGRRLLKNQCGECGRVLSSVAALESHVSLHAGRRPFSCTLCGKRFPDSKGLKRHGRVHRNGRIHVCSQCGKGFVYRFGLTKHLLMVHRRIKPFICQICNKGFFTKRDVEAHIRIHTGEKPFHCNLCEKKFARRVELNVHLRWHNGEKRHWCPFCGKGFLDFNNLKRHKYIHTGEKPHSCPHCPKKFTQSGHLKKHVKNVHKILDP